MTPRPEVAVGQDSVLSRLPAGARILVIRLRSMGDTVLMTPALRLLHDWRPDLKVSVLVEPPWEQLLDGSSAIDSVLVLENKLRSLLEIRRSHFSLVVNLHGGPTSAFLTRMSGSAFRAGLQHYRDPSAYNLHVPTAQEILSRQGTVHTAEHVASCFFWLGVPFAKIPAAQVSASPAAVKSVRERLLEMGLGSGERYAVIHPTASYPTKQWPASGFAEIDGFLRKRYGLHPVHICAENESATLGQIESCAGRPILRACGWPLREVIALISHSNVFAGNDSGPAHIAAATGVPTLVIFGSSHSAVWRPWNAAHSAVVQNFYECNPCAGDHCYVYPEPRCILSIPSEQVKQSLAGLLM